jgi:hypothetical protein
VRVRKHPEFQHGAKLTRPFNGHYVLTTKAKTMCNNTEYLREKEEGISCYACPSLRQEAKSSGEDYTVHAMTP